MYRVLALSLVLAPLPLVFGQDGKDQVVTPSKKEGVLFPVLVEPIPERIIQQASRLTGDQLYVVTSEVQCFMLASPPGLVAISEDTGPLRVRGQFVDGTKTETRTYRQKQVFLIEATGKGTVELLVVIVGKTKPEDVLRKTLDVDNGVAPRPPPDPPGPTPTPAPIPLPGFRVMMQYEEASLTPEQEGVVYGMAVRMYLQSKCVVGTDGMTKDFWILRAGLDTKNAPKWVGDQVQRHPGQKAWMVVSDGKVGYDGPLPANANEAMSILTKIGGAP